LLDDAVPVLLQRVSNICGFGCQNLASYHNYHIPCWQAMLIFAKAFAKQPFQRIALDCFFYLFPGDCKAEARARTRIFCNQDCHPGIATSNIVLKYLLEIARAG